MKIHFVLLLLLLNLNLNCYAAKDFGTDDVQPPVVSSFQAPQSLYDFENKKSKVNLSEVFDASFTILSTSGDTKDITIAQKGNRIYFYDHYLLYGSVNGYDQNQVVSVFSELLPPDTYLKSVRKKSAIGIVTIALIVGFIETQGSPATNLVQIVNLNGASDFVLRLTSWLTVTSMASVLLIPTVMIYEKDNGKPAVYDNMRIGLIGLNRGEHPETFKGQSRSYSEYIHEMVQIIDPSFVFTQCTAYFSTQL